MELARESRQLLHKLIAKIYVRGKELQAPLKIDQLLAICHDVYWQERGNISKDLVLEYIKKEEGNK